MLSQRAAVNKLLRMSFGWESHPAVVLVEIFEIIGRHFWAPLLAAFAISHFGDNFRPSTAVRGFRGPMNTRSG
jgi:hypothetical protein